jgi:two-component system sensor histidine kinase HydH
MLPDGERPRAKALRVVDEAVRLETLTNDLLAYVRTGELHRAPVAPAEVLRAAAAAVAHPDTAAIAIDDRGAPAAWTLDADRMRQVLTNLLDNAVAAGPPVTAAISAAGGSLTFTITDHGPGIPAEDRPNLFEPFFTRKTQGTGLGLAIARRVVEQHGGRIVVDDAPGGGARFRVELPPTMES